MIRQHNPIYNADGNERVSVRNRGTQNGPVGGMGQRHNAQDLDLNRDNTKLETAEARSLARVLTTYDPHIAIDLHTTNGSDHGFYLTYETSVSPNTSPGITRLVRGDLLPSVTKAVKARGGWSYFYYGGPTRSGERVWAGDLDLYKPRYTQTYFGIRNRIGWDFSGPYDFAMWVNGTPVVGNYEKHVSAAVDSAIRADADRQREVLLAEAFRDAQKIKGDGDAKASALYAQAFGQNPDFAQFYRRLEAYRAAFKTRSDVLVIDQSSEFFKYMKGPNGGSGKPAPR